MLVKIVPSIQFSFTQRHDLIEYADVASSVQVDEKPVSVNIYNPWATSKTSRGIFADRIRKILSVVENNHFHKNEVLAFIYDTSALADEVQAPFLASVNNQLVHPDFEICPDGVTLQIESSENVGEIIGESTILSKPKVFSDFISVKAHTEIVDGETPEVLVAKVTVVIDAPLHKSFLNKGERGSTFDKVRNLVKSVAEGKLPISYKFTIDLENEDATALVGALIQDGGKLSVSKEHSNAVEFLF